MEKQSVAAECKVFALVKKETHCFGVFSMFWGVFTGSCQQKGVSAFYGCYIYIYICMYIYVCVCVCLNETETLLVKNKYPIGLFILEALCRIFTYT